MKVIYIISFSPKYQFLSHSKDTTGMIHFWENPKGEYIGIFKMDWGARIINKLHQLHPGPDYEIWRPDIRADKTYQFESENGIKYLSFPGKKAINRNGIKLCYEEYSSEIVEKINSYIQCGERLTLIFPFVPNKLFTTVMKLFDDRIPIVVPHLINIDNLYTNFSTYNPISLIHRFFISLHRKRLLQRVKYFSIPNLEGGARLEEKYKFHLSFFHPGIDTLNLPQPFPKVKVREKLSIPEDVTLLLVSSRMVPEKQVDKLIKVLSVLKQYNWQLYITGYGEPEHISLINQIITENDLTDRIKLCGYVSDELLIQYYCASDLYCIPSIMEGGPISAVMAIWYKLPIFSTNTGTIAEFLNRTHSGLVVGTTNYIEWENKLTLFFKGKEIILPPMNDFLEIFSTDSNIHKLNNMIMESAAEYYPV